MPTTRPIQRCTIEAYVEDKLLGYVRKITECGNSVTTYICERKCYFNLRRSQAMQKSAKISDVCIVGDTSTGMKLYPQKDAINFKIVREE